MPTSAAIDAPAQEHRWPTFPSWGISVVLHALLFLALGYSLQRTPRGGLQSDPGREVGVALKRIDQQGEQYFESAPQESTAAASSPSTNRSASPAQIVGSTSPVDTTAALPASKPLVGPGGGDTSSAGGALGLTKGSGPNTSGLAKAGYTKVPFMGLEGEGRSFVFVLDRSASMGNERFSPLGAAKAQLKASLGQLTKLNRFQIIFFNQDPRMSTLSGVSASGPTQKLAFGEPQNIEQANRFIDGVLADGGTDYLPALEMALGLGSDVIFFLTDAGTPLSEAQIERIVNRNHGASIHVIEFGEGPSLSGSSSMARLAAANQGRYRYFDITQGFEK